MDTDQFRREKEPTHGAVLRGRRGLAWLGGLSLDLKLGIRMLLKYPGLSVAGGLALAIAIGIGAGWYGLAGMLMSPAIPLPEGDRVVLIETQDTLANEMEPRVTADFLEWRRELRTIEDLGAYRSDTRNLIVANAAPRPIYMAELTAGAFAASRVAPLLGRGLHESDDAAGAPPVVVIGYDVWQRDFGGRPDAVGSNVRLGSTPAIVVGVMPEGFGYPVSHHAWTPLPLGTSYGALEGGAIDVVGRLAPGATLAEARAELRVLGERASAAQPATHAHLRPVVRRLGEASDVPGLARFAITNLPVLLILMIACLSVGTLVYARTATREGEIALRSALGASRARIVGQLFVESLVLASLAAAAGLLAADRGLQWGLTMATDEGGAPFWMTTGLPRSTLLYAGGLAVVSAAMLSLLPALKATRARVQPHLASLGAGGATLRFGRVWTGAMIVQVALTAMGIPVAMETASEAAMKQRIRAAFPSGGYLAARVELDRPSEEEGQAGFEARRARTFAALAERLAREPGVVAVTFADRAPGSVAASEFAAVEPSGRAGPAYDDAFWTLSVGPGFFEAFDRPIVAGRAFDAGDWSATARTAIVNEAFARQFARETGGGSPVGARLRSRGSRVPSDASSTPRVDEIVGVVRDLGLSPDDSGDEIPFVFHPASAETVSPFVMSVRVRGDAAPLAARLPVLAAGIDARLHVQDAQSLGEWVRQRDAALNIQAWALAAVTLLVLFLSALGIFSLVSVSVSRRTREIGLRVAIGASPRQVLAGIVSQAAALVATGIAAGGALVLLSVALGEGPSGRPAEDVALFARYLAMTSAVMLAASLLACIGPARRALRIDPAEALRTT